MSPSNTTPELSDDDGRPASALGSSSLRNIASANRRRSTRACDQCRRTKSKCEPSDVDHLCRACATLGIPCTYAGPSHKRGPPKGYILALERRLHQVEALLGTIISSEDQRARSLVDDLARDPLASHIVRRVRIGPFGPRGRLQQPFGSTKEDFLAAIMIGAGDGGGNGSGGEASPSRTHFQEENLALISPDRDWQDRLQSLLTSSPATRTHSSLPPSLSSSPYNHPQLPHTQAQQCQHQHHHQQQQPQYALPSLRQLASPAPTQLLPIGTLYPASTKLESPVSQAALLAPLNGGGGGGGGGGGYGRGMWDSASANGGYGEPNYELASAGTNGHHSGPQPQMNGRDAYRGLAHGHGHGHGQGRGDVGYGGQGQHTGGTPPWYFAQEAVS